MFFFVFFLRAHDAQHGIFIFSLPSLAMITGDHVGGGGRGGAESGHGLAESCRGGRSMAAVFRRALLFWTVLLVCTKRAEPDPEEAGDDSHSSNLRLHVEDLTEQRACVGSEGRLGWPMGSVGV